VPISGIRYTLKYPVISLAHAVTSRGVVVPLREIAVESGGSLTFASQPLGDFLAFSYFYRPTYIMLDLLHQIRDSRNTEAGASREFAYPSQAVGKLDFLVKDEGYVG
jgi:hypothetical protein